MLDEFLRQCLVATLIVCLKDTTDVLRDKHSRIRTVTSA
jgi:hypothetical protein